MDDDVDVKSTREKLLDTAEALFFEKGYENVSIRELTGAAGTNVAAINYYFQSKESLYRESVRRRLSYVADELITAIKREINRDDVPDLRKVISVYVTEYMGKILTVKEAGRFLETISRDMSEGGMVTDILSIRYSRTPSDGPDPIFLKRKYPCASLASEDRCFILCVPAKLSNE
jgi:AcrR family transcriptional regulator